MIIRKTLMPLLLFPLLVGCMGMNGCNSGLFNTEPFVDTAIGDDGNKLLADTPRMWADFTELTQRRIEREVDHARPPGVDTWNKHWINTIGSIKTNTENPDRYINYIINSRRKADLPELVFDDQTYSRTPIN